GFARVVAAPPAGVGGQHRASDAADAPGALGRAGAPRRRAARARRQERPDRVARRLRREAAAQLQGLGSAGGPPSPADARQRQGLTFWAAPQSSFRGPSTA